MFQVSHCTASVCVCVCGKNFAPNTQLTEIELKAESQEVIRRAGKESRGRKCHQVLHS